MIDSINVLNQNRVLPSSLNVVRNFKSVIWNTQYYDTGDFQMTLPATDVNLSIFTNPNNQFIARSDDENVGLIETLLIKRSCAEPSIEVSGRFAKALLDQRIVGDIGVVQSSGKTSYTPEFIHTGRRIETAIRTILSTTMMDTAGDTNPRRISFLHLGADSNIPQQVLAERQSTGESMLDFTDGTLYEYGLGAKVILSGSDFYYVVYQGSDRSLDNLSNNKPIVFSPKMSNFINTEKRKDITTHKNAVIIGGQGEGADRFYSALYWRSGVALKTGIDRRELFIDARDLAKTYTDSGGTEHTYTDREYSNLLVVRAQRSLNEMGIEETYSGETNPGATGYEYKKDYNVGDIVSLVDEDGNYIKPRITSVVESQDENDGYSVFPNLSLE